MNVSEGADADELDIAAKIADAHSDDAFADVLRQRAQELRAIEQAKQERKSL